MANSTTTLLQAVNRVLLDVGERQVSNFSSPAASKAKAYLADAFTDLQNFHDWEWARTILSVTNWDLDEATFTNLRRIQDVIWNNPNSQGSQFIPHVDLLTYQLYASEPFVNGVDGYYAPSRWTQLNEETIKVNPYPTDSIGQGQLKVNGWQYLAPPENGNDVFQCPERFMSTLIKRAVYTMTVRHLGDLQSAQLIEGEFFQQLTAFRSKEALVTTKGVNMWRRR